MSPSQESPSRGTYVLVIGKPVSNCHDKTNQTVTTKYTNEVLVTETWSVDFSIGVSFLGLSVTGGAGWSKSTGVKASQQVSFSIPPGQMVYTFPFSNKMPVSFFLFFFISGGING